MTSEPLILAVDLGTSGMKVALITIKGKVLGWESEPIGIHITPDGGVEQSPDEWWATFLVVSNRLLGHATNSQGEPVSRKAIRAVCCSTQGEGTVPVDREGNALMNCILWMDMRGAPCLGEQFKGADQPHRCRAAEYPALDPPDRWNAIHDRQRSRRAHAAHPRMLPRDLREDI